MLLKIMVKILNCPDCIIWFNRSINSSPLATALTISEGGYIYEHGTHIDLDWIQLLLSPFAWSVGILSHNFSSLYFIRFLTYYAHKANDQPAYDMTRQWHIFGATYDCDFIICFLIS